MGIGGVMVARAANIDLPETMFVKAGIVAQILLAGHDLGPRRGAGRLLITIR